MSDFVDKLNDFVVSSTKSLKGPQMAALLSYAQ